MHAKYRCMQLHPRHAHYYHAVIVGERNNGTLLFAIYVSSACDTLMHTSRVVTNMGNIMR
jgi:hypothetical protein